MPDNDKDDLLAPIHRDPAWPRARDAAHAYASLDRGYMYRDEDGSTFWRPEPTEQQTRYLQELVSARSELAKRHDGRGIDNAIFAEAERAGLSAGYEPGIDVDGETFYEPEGNPGTQLRAALERQDYQLRYGALSDADLRALISARSEQYNQEALGDNFATMGRLAREQMYLRSILHERHSQTRDRAEQTERARQDQHRDLDRGDSGLGL